MPLMDMQAWIKVEGDIDGKFRPLLVLNLEQATVLSEGNAQQIALVAGDAYPNYAWRLVETTIPNKYVVHGKRRG